MKKLYVYADFDWLKEIELIGELGYESLRGSGSYCFKMCIRDRYKSGVPLIIHDADKLLKILEEEDYVRLVPYSYHNYMGYQEEGSVYELPGIRM